MKKKSILIAGGTGFIGSHLINKLSKYNWKIYCIHLNKPIKNKSKKVIYINLNIKNKKLLLKKFKYISFDYIINLAGHIDHSARKKTYDSHFIGCKNLIELGIIKRIKKFIQIGSSVEYGFSRSPINEKRKLKSEKLNSIYGISKLKASEYLTKKGKQNNLKYIILRPFLIFGPGQNEDRLIPMTIKKSFKNIKFPCSNGEQVRDFLYISDFINLLMKAMNSSKVKNMIINAGSGKPVKVKKVINLINKIIKKGIPQFGKIELRKDEPKNLYANINLSRKVLNWKPLISLDNGIKKTIKYYKK